ncbi:nitrous oxidase accessory protein [Haloferax elongans ATCC BAA-1513]|uniref:Nitrous oxidase accessory protein n=1 Tax=Haloferax elongans ATCC BAA-1513 TaxID=1230453 RepID=M0HIR8_HALEO|nr:SipW-dependent-type signal peptide-containing protein [Haloferax elongans]ELZ82974.1 nitrous oxidase accessory protein [Haloferax elongans ATCC BAA-1513]
MTDDNITLSRRTLLGGMAGIGLAAGALGTGTYALLSDTESSADNTITAGTLNLKVDGQNSVSETINISSAGSGSSGSGTATLSNTGSTHGKLGFGIENVENFEGANPESESGDTSNPGELDQYVWVEVGVIQNGVKVPGVGPAPLSVLDDLSRMTGSILRAGSTATMYIDWMVPDLGNDAQGDRAEFDVIVDIEERPVWSADTVVTSGDSIQAAIDAASSGDVIEVRNGTYTGDLVIDKPLTLLSKNGAEYTKIVGDGSTEPGGAPNVVVNVTSSDVTVEGFTIDGLSSTQGALDIAATLSDISIICNRLIGNGGNNLGTLQPGDYSDIEVSRNVFDGAPSLMAYINGAASGGTQSQNITFVDNYFGGEIDSTSKLTMGFEADGGEIARNMFLTDISGAPYAQLELFGSSTTIEDNLFEVPAGGVGIRDGNSTYNNTTLRNDNTFFGDGTDVQG